MARLVVSVVGGFLLGGTYALIALGLVQAFRSTGTFNFAHGQLMILPAFFVATWMADGAMPFVQALVASLAITALLGMAMFLFVLRRTIGLPHFVGFAATLGVAAILDGYMQMRFGSIQIGITFPGLPSGSVTIFGAGVSQVAIIFALAALAIAIAVVVLMRFTKLGIRIRAAGQDAVLASQGGINVRRVYLGSWALAAVLAACAGIVYGSTNIMDLSAVGLALGAFPAIVLGGLDSVEGAVVGGVVIGLLQSFAASYMGGQYTNVVTYSVLLVVLLVFPSGFFGTKDVTRL
jgi:branched-chain amino acid transport system permease protein